jgi:hypothetical protein
MLQTEKKNKRHAPVLFIFKMKRASPTEYNGIHHNFFFFFFFLRNIFIDIIYWRAAGDINIIAGRCVYN